MTIENLPLQRGFKSVSRILLSLVLLTSVGVLGFRLIEGANWIDCLYMTVITLSTVGYEHVIQPSDAGKLFITAYIILGLGVFTYSAFTLGQWIVSAEFRRHWERHRMDRAIEQLRGHYLVCGFGRMGRMICEELAAQNAEFVVIDHDIGPLEVCVQRGWFHVAGDATDDAVLHRAGIEHAAAVAAALPSDAENVFVALSTRMLSNNIRIIARASEERSAEKLRRAGANRVVSPLASGATKVARFLVNPDLEDFFDITEIAGEQLELADVRIPANSKLAGRSLHQTQLRRHGLTVLCVRRKDGSRIVTPNNKTQINPEDLLVLFGTETAVQHAADLIASS